MKKTSHYLSQLYIYTFEIYVLTDSLTQKVVVAEVIAPSQVAAQALLEEQVEDYDTAKDLLKTERLRDNYEALRDYSPERLVSIIK